MQKNSIQKQIKSVYLSLIPFGIRTRKDEGNFKKMTKPEGLRKSIHLASLLVPIVTYYSLLSAQIILILAAGLYSYSEWLKLKGKKFFLHPLITKAQRPDESKEFARAPLFLALGVLAAISVYSWQASVIAIYQVGFCDTVAAFCGRQWGKKPIPLFERKTLAGSLGYFIAALPVMLVFLSPSKAITISLVGAFLEAVPLRDWDNMTIPVFIGFLAENFM